MTNTRVDLAGVRRVWSAQYGEGVARRMLGGQFKYSFGDPPAGLAYDSKFGLGRRVGRDQSETETSSEPDEKLIARCRVFLKNRLSPEDFDRLERLLAGEGEDLPDDSGSTRWARGGQDDPPEFEGSPRTNAGRANLLPRAPGYENIPEENRVEFRDRNGGRDRRPAMDSRGSDYFSLCPANARVSFGYGD